MLIGDRLNGQTSGVLSVAHANLCLNFLIELEIAAQITLRTLGCLNKLQGRSITNHVVTVCENSVIKL